MGWQYVPLKTKFEKVIFGTVGFSVGVPVVLCMVADAYAKTILEWSGFLLQMVALGMAAWEINQLDVKTFNGPGFWVRMGWKPGMPVVVRLTGSSAGLHPRAGLMKVNNPTDDLNERIRRLEATVIELAKVDERLDNSILEETKARKAAVQVLATELNAKVSSVSKRLKEATLGNDLERVYAALILAFMGTVFSTFNKCIGGWF